MFRRDVYRAMAPILEALDPGAFERAGFALGGATRIALALGEVRESRDLDFLGSSPSGYADLRSAVRERGVAALCRAGASLEVPREPTADQYGIRFPVRVADGRDVKVELGFEARIALEAAVHEAFVSVPCLSRRDAWAEKLLACSDRGNDPASLARDVVDLAVMRERWSPIPEPAWSLAEGAYGRSVRRDLSRALQQFRASAESRARAIAGLRVDDEALVMSGVEHLAEDLGLPPPTAE